MSGGGEKWHHGVTRYQWLVLAVASLGWVFDAFEGQLFNITRGDLLPDLLRAGNAGIADAELATQVKLWGDVVRENGIRWPQ